MGRMTVKIDDDLLRDAQEHLGTRSKRETIIVALEGVRRRRMLRQLRDDLGRVELDIDQDELRRIRGEG